MNLLLVQDETMTGEVFNKLTLEFSEEQVTIKDIISKRVEKEVKEYNQNLPSVFHGLIQPSDTESYLNGFKMKKKVIIDAEKQIYVALTAFHNNGFFVLIDDYQAESLNELITIKEYTKISFIKLIPLVGG